MKKFALIFVFAVILSIAVVSVAGAAPPMQGGGNVHYVAYGETLYSIAARYGVSVEAVMRQNGLYNPNMIYAGQPLRIPGGYGALPPGYGPGPGACSNYHTVAPGETLSGIAWNYGTTMYDMMAQNHFYNQDMVYAGQSVCVPGRPAYVAHPVPAPLLLPAPVEEVVVAEEYAGAEIVIPGPAPAYAPMYEEAEAAPPVAPEYEPKPAVALLPRAKHPIEVVVNGGAVWVGEAYPDFPDPDGDTVLIVSTRESDKPTVFMRSGDYEVKGELGLVPEFGVDQYRFAFRYIPPGDYDVWFEDPDGTPSEKAQVTVEGGKRVEVNFRKGVGFTGPTYASPDGWVLGDWTNPSKPGQNIGGWSNILIHTPASGLWVNIESEGAGYSAKCFTGTKGPGACDFAGLNAGLYWIWIDGTDLTLKTYMDGNAYAEFTFNRQPVESSENLVGPVSYSD